MERLLICPRNFLSAATSARGEHVQGEHVNQTPTDFFSEVLKNLHQLGQSTDLTADERDIIDEYEDNEFGAKQCAEHIARSRS
jgi:hypothetical protein